MLLLNNNGYEVIDKLKELKLFDQKMLHIIALKLCMIRPH